MIGVALLGGTLLWYYFLYRTSPRDPIGDQVIAMSEHGAPFFIRSWEHATIWIAPILGLVILFLVGWLDHMDKKKHGRLYRHSPIPDWRGRPKSHPRDIITYEFGLYIVPWMLVCSLAIATGGRVPFALFGFG